MSFAPELSSNHAKGLHCKGGLSQPPTSNNVHHLQLHALLRQQRDNLIPAAVHAHQVLGRPVERSQPGVYCHRAIFCILVEIQCLPPFALLLDAVLELFDLGPDAMALKDRLDPAHGLLHELGLDLPVAEAEHVAVDALLHVVAEVAHAVLPVLGHLVQPFHVRQRAHQGLHPAELPLEELDVFAHPLEHLELVAEQGGELAEDGAKRPRPDPHARHLPLAPFEKVKPLQLGYTRAMAGGV
uniref:Uncharacterized protein n=1 Tax=Triticum urartu TaxID=4572 RepID=A0A8R7R687_TRIUA